MLKKGSARWIVIGILIVVAGFVVMLLWNRSIRTSTTIPTAKNNIAARSPITEGDLVETEVPKKLVTSEVVTSAEELVGQYTTTKVWQGQPFYKKQLSQYADFMSDVPPTERAVAVELDLPRSVAGMITAEDRVDVVACSKEGAKILMQNVLVLDAGPVGDGGEDNAAEGQEEAMGSAQRYVVILSVNPVDAEKIVLCAVNDGIYLAKDPYQFEEVPTPGVTPDNLFGPISTSTIGR